MELSSLLALPSGLEVAEVSAKALASYRPSQSVCTNRYLPTLRSCSYTRPQLLYPFRGRCALCRSSGATDFACPQVSM
jgi:hypothetical protein